MSEPKRYACCACCEGVAKDDHVEHGGFIEKDGHDGPCGTCEFAKQIRPWLAAAWDAGYDARGRDIANEGLIYTELTPNPYSVTPPGGSDA